ncbi:ABC transporter ATP-binding protein [Pseudoflavonifractor sp. 524-17]|uniref:ABC transporter ATP-binding protein n=1 Tax=Pseudoflavonifractor sp. 524-17 TaxID=2304577 RepID=UPI00137B0396|nr:ABC transporter ATP-binding protein [Pseudoflavonifractor sp. 524-17]NCE63962.1 ABC transporter ATP-binding protein [Pseudoflavonifractor sp. 524-17]
MNVVEMHGIYKYFGDFCANKNVDFTLKQGEIHALLGENGAGKSTLMNILYGLYGHDEGQILLNGNEVHMDSPSVAIENGIGMVHQHFMLIPQLTVTQNIFLGMEKETGVVHKIKDLDRRVQELNDRYGFNVSPQSLIWQIPVGVQQKVEILKVLMRNAKILILDEPTAVLTPHEVEELFQSIRMLADNGYSIILITHKMSEVMTYADRVTVMRLGEVIGSVNVKDSTEEELAHMMVGRDVNLERQIQPQPTGGPLLEIKDLHVHNDKNLNAVNGVTFTVHAGEIVGIAGVDGNGQLELGEAIVGGRKIESGDVRIEGSSVAKATIRGHLDAGLAHIPDDRLAKGLVLQFPVKQNLIMGSQRKAPFAHGLMADNKAVTQHGGKMVQEFDIRPHDAEYLAGGLSGGNQQKVILAREVGRDPKVLLAIQPTRGLDIGAIEFVRSKLVEERSKGKAVLLISTDLDEIRSLSDRILVMHGGRFMGEVSADVDIGKLGLMMAGKSEAEILAASVGKGGGEK